MGFTTDAIRNIAVAGHGGTGKTTLVEQILFTGGAISKPETVESGKTTSDYTEEEIERKISIHSSLSHISWENKLVNILDTPGSGDFSGEVIAAFRVAEAAILLVGAKAGVQIETIKLWRQLNVRSMPRIVFVNKMERENANFSQTLADLKTHFDFPFVPVTVPIGSGADYRGVINLIDMKAYLVPEPGKKEVATDIPADQKSLVEEFRAAMIESAAEGDDELIAKFFDAGTLTEEEIRRGLLEGLRDNRVCPVFCGSAMAGSGVLTLMNFICRTVPSPAGRSEISVSDDGSESPVSVSSEGQASCFVFKTSIDQFSGKLSFIKVVTGVVKPDMELFSSREKHREKVNKIYKIVGKKLEETPEIPAGDLGVLVKLDTVRTCDTLSASADHSASYKRLSLPHPVHSVTVVAKSKKDEDRLAEFLHRTVEEDLTFTMSFNAETKETVISGMGELHISMILDRIRETQKVEMETKVPRVAYRETITKSSDAEYTHKKQSGGHGQYGRVVIAVRPLPRGEHYHFENAIRGMAVSKGYIPGIEKGLHDAMEQGVLAGYPVVGVGVQLTDGKEHPVDSSEMSFRLAAKGALRAAMEKAGPVLLEPIMNLRVFANSEHVGDILSDLSSRRGRVLGQNSIGGGIEEIDAQVPQAELLRYSIDLRSITSGTASFEVEFDHYSPLTGKIADNVINEAKELAAAAHA
ncbi:MAG TPA: elongation factor G [Spirochaetia bacterium]|nr:elongation factor G [Spirochaetia bacterium]